MANRFIIGRGEVLTYEIPPPKSGGAKVHPYSLAEAKTALIPLIQEMAAQVQALPTQACPGGLAVAKMTLHPAYIAKSFFPTGLLRGAGLISVGSRTVRVAPRKDTRKRLLSNAKPHKSLLLERESHLLDSQPTRNSWKPASRKEPSFLRLRRWG